MANEPDETPIALSSATFARHAQAVEYVDGMIRTRAPWPSTSRFPGLAPGAWGKLAAGDTITAGSGLTLGSGSVKLCDSSGTVYPEDETVDVVNPGVAIDGGGSGRIVLLKWVVGEWSVACQGGS